MAVKSNYDEKVVQQDLNNQLRLIKKRIISAFIYEGLRFIQECREQPGDHALGNYMDVTGNLRNSIQFFVFDDGELVESSESAFESSNYADVQSLVKNHGIQLIGIAGMNYASAVEAKGYNVISRQQEIIVVELNHFMSIIGDR